MTGHGIVESEYSPLPWTGLAASLHAQLSLPCYLSPLLAPQSACSSQPTPTQVGISTRATSAIQAPSFGILISVYSHMDSITKSLSVIERGDGGKTGDTWWLVRGKLWPCACKFVPQNSQTHGLYLLELPDI